MHSVFCLEWLYQICNFTPVLQVTMLQRVNHMTQSDFCEPPVPMIPAACQSSISAGTSQYHLHSHNNLEIYVAFYGTSMSIMQML